MAINNIKSFIISSLLVAQILTLIGQVSANPFIIKEEISDKLDAVKDFGQHEFEVDVRGRTVTIDGFVSSEADKQRVEKIARSTEGVDRIVNNLRVTGPSVVMNSDVARRIRDSLKARENLKNYQLEITQEGNNIILAGEAANEGDRQLIGSVANSQAQGLTVQNKLRIRVVPELPDATVQQSVLAALKSEGVSGLDTVTLSTNQGIVHFAGQVNNHREIDRILSIALMVDGVKSVRSSVKILHPTSP